MGLSSKPMQLVSLGIGIVLLLVAGAVLLSGYLHQGSHNQTSGSTGELQRFENAAAKGDAVAMNNLGLIYFEGRNVARNEKLARQWFEKAAAAGNTSAMNNLGLTYEHPDTPGENPDYQQARSWFEKAVSAGDASAMFHLGVMYEEAEGVARNYQIARRLYEKAAQAGNADAQQRLQQLPR